ncbi:MAG TPA: DUF1854 domain-containing protein [Planctomycetaceae bacterium]|nr:DUF1854 domain-containing protein [Planctomycetaceae bacterium]
MNINDCRFTCSSDEKVTLLTPAGDRHVAVRIVRAFPFTAADGPVAVVDNNGDEIIWIKDLDSLSLTHQQFIQSQLEREEFLPRIHFIESVSRGTPRQWNVATDRGQNSFEQASSDGVVWHPDGSVSITDCDGICYLIPAVQRLDRRSRRLLERYS